MTLPDPTDASLPIGHVLLLLGPPLACAAAALHAGGRRRAPAAWRAARAAATASLACAILSLAAVLAGSCGTAFGVRADPLGGVVTLVVTLVGWVIVRYSNTCLDGQRGQRRYVRWLMATLSAVSIVVATNHLLAMALAWTGTSLALHRLLTFHAERAPAVLAAHKKFIVARLADLCMLAAVGLLFQAFGTLRIDTLAARAATWPALPTAAGTAMLLVALAAMLRCAQLPFHGWLIQVMEAPTPVSALLHAGVVNLGAVVLMRLAPVLAGAPAAQALLVVAGTATAVLAALVATTRISVKVALAWSTCAQMGFMLLECGLGAWEAALLHLAAHALYKAHAFLGAGGAVRRSAIAQLAPPPAPPRPRDLALAAGIGLVLVVSAGAAVGLLVPGRPAPAAWLLGGIGALALVPLIHPRSSRRGGPTLAALGLAAFGVALAGAGQQALLSVWALPGTPTPATALPDPALWVGAAIAFAALFLLQSLIAIAPRQPLVRRLYPWFYGGLFLDEAFMRIAFRLWPPPPARPAATAGPATPAGDAAADATGVPA